MKFDVTWEETLEEIGKKTCLGYLKMMKQVKTNIGKSYRANMCANNENKETRWEKTSLGECMNTCFVREMEP